MVGIPQIAIQIRALELLILGGRGDENSARIQLHPVCYLVVERQAPR